MKPILECKGLSKKYNKSAYALHNLNLTLNHGQIIGLPVSYTHLYILSLYPENASQYLQALLLREGHP